jgi:hypothetical protein
MILFDPDYLTSHEDLLNSRISQFTDGRNYTQIGEQDLEYTVNIAEDIYSMVKVGMSNTGEAVAIVTTTFKK